MINNDLSINEQLYWTKIELKSALFDFQYLLSKENNEIDYIYEIDLITDLLKDLKNKIGEAK